jgi:hypothetical protein
MNSQPASPSESASERAPCGDNGPPEDFKWPTNEELLALADKYPAPQEWYDEE